ncbi:MAG: translocation/assembly module TamB domain-containing protein [Geobacteraceae bacterium]|nr:translocation/assembly module TamB domain-containing protein [Geobacteraceae bacterium]
MTRATRHMLAILLCCAALAAAAGVAWLAGTEEGARWLLGSLSRRSGGKIALRQVEGRLLDRLRLAGVRLMLPRLEAEIDTLELRWRPLLLLTGRVAVQELTLRGVRLTDTAPAREQPAELAWPTVSGIAVRLEVGVERLRVDGLSYRRPDQPPQVVDTISTSLAWRELLLSLDDLSFASPAGRVAGSVAAGFHRPSLSLDLAVTPAQPVAGMDRLTLRTRLLPGRGAEQLAGSVAVTAGSAVRKRLELSGEVGMTRTAFNLRELRLTSPGRRGTASGAGTLLVAAQEPLLQLRLKADGLDLAPELKVPTDLSGELTFEGGPAGYRGRFNVANRGKGWRSARVAGAFQGDAAGMELATLDGSLLDGSLQGNIAVGWRQGLSLSGKVLARRLNPALLAPDWTGVVNFDLSGKAAWPEGAPLRGEVAGNLLESRLHGQALTGELRADFADGNLRIGRLELQGKGFDISAAGELARRLAFSAQVSDLSLLIPGTAGELRGGGWLSWRDGELGGSVSGHGRGLAADGVRIDAAEITARLEEGKDHPVRVSAALRKVVYDRFRADSATLELAGTTLRHTAEATFRSAGAEAQLGLTGAWRDGSWQGEIVRCSGRDGVGPWSLTAPARLAVAATGISLSPLALAGAPPERLEMAGELSREPLGGTVRAEWGNVNLARANPWLNEVRISGASSGKVELRLLAGERLSVAGSASAHGTVTTDGRRITIERSLMSLDWGEQGMRAGLELSLAEGGMLKATLASPAPARLAIPEEGEVAAEWDGLDLAPLRPWLPREARLEGRLSGRLSGKFLAGGRLDLKGRSSLSRGMVRWQGERQGLDATLGTAEASWEWRGALPAGTAGRAPERLVVSGRVSGEGTVTAGGQRLTVQRSALAIDWNERGLQAGVELHLAAGGMLKGTISSPGPARLAIPEEGRVAAEWERLDLALLGPWLPGAVKLEGRLAGRLTGKLLPGSRLELQGDAAIAEGRARWQGPGGELSANLRTVSLSWGWQGETLRGTIALALAEYGEARGSFQLPLPARLPASFEQQGAVQASLTGQVREKGVLTAFFPGLIQESRGELGFDLRLGGQWQEPRFGGNLKLAEAGAYLPTAGIHLKEVQLAATLEKELIRIDSFRAASGPGHIEGTAEFRLQGWRVTGYRGSISGERFQAVYLPELQLLGAPRLTFEGTPDKLAVRGEVNLPELLVFGQPGRAPVAPSSDVIVEGAPPPVDKPLPVALDIQLRVVLGDRVLVKAEGIDAQLGGTVELTLRDLDRITSRGEIRVVKGRYRTYGLDLAIERGRLYYAGGPIGQPTLDILALRTIDDVRAGVLVGGTPRLPVIKLYAEPAMPDVDIMAYIVLGHPLGDNREQASLVAQAAGFLFSTGQSVILQDQIKSRLGLSTLELKTASETSAPMGYKAITVTPPGVAAAKPATGISQTMLTVGKYLTPKLYFSYGRSLFTGGNLFRLRYDIFKRWQIETQTGTESGVDLYYKIDFN